MSDETRRRLEKIERENRWMKAGLAVLLLVSCAVFVMGQVPGQEREQSEYYFGRAFVVVDEAGNARATLGVDDNGNPALGMLDEAGTMRAILGLSDGKPLLGMSDEADNVRATLGLSDHGVPVLGMSDEAGNMRATLGFTEEGEPGIGIFDANGKLEWGAP